MIQVISLIGAALILFAYASIQLGWLRSGQPLFNVLNLVGSAALTYVAVVESQLGFMVLEGTWAVLSAVALVRRPSGAD